MGFQQVKKIISLVVPTHCKTIIAQSGTVIGIKFIRYCIKKN